MKVVKDRKKVNEKTTWDDGGRGAEGIKKGGSFKKVELEEVEKRNEEGGG